MTNALLARIEERLPANLDNDELVAMGVAYLALSEFSRDVQHRMLHWINDRLTADFQTQAREERSRSPF
jgi:hypothetical protein